ncbi:MAG TPA: hypothetical protein VGH13_12665 [Xanthobacteraceae bacterium]|jgi:hypothetical protein
MSMELRLFSDRQLESIAQWQCAIDAEAFPLRLSAERSLDAVAGFLPSYLQGRLTGFECNHWNSAEVMAEYPTVEFSHDWKYVLAFRWSGSKRDEMRVAWMAAAAYARATDGVVFDELDGKVRTADQALEVVRDLESDDQHIVEAAVKEALRRLRSQS